MAESRLLIHILIQDVKRSQALSTGTAHLHFLLTVVEEDFSLLKDIYLSDC